MRGFFAGQSCLLNFSKEERMTGDCRWNCTRCKTKRDAVKRIVIWKLPPIVIIVLKRYAAHGYHRVCTYGTHFSHCGPGLPGVILYYVYLIATKEYSFNSRGKPLQYYDRQGQ